MRRTRISDVTAAAMCVGALTLAAAMPAGAAFTDLGILGTGPGPGAGQLDGPAGVDVGPDGSVYVAEEGNSRISKFAPSGAFERAWGKNVDPAGGTGFEVCTTACQAGTGGFAAAGEFGSPSDVAVAPDGAAVYVADSTNRRVMQFNPDGTFVRAWGRDVTPGGGTDFEICSATCKAGIDGEEGGHLSRPDRLAVGPSGDVYVMEGINSRISQFASAGAPVPGDFVRAFGENVDSGGGTGFETCTDACQKGEGSETDVAVSAGGEVYATSDQTGGLVNRFSAAGVFLAQVDLETIPVGGLEDPERIDIAASGELLMANSNSPYSVYRLLSGFTFIEAFVLGPAAGDQADDIAYGLDASTTYVAQRTTDRVRRYAISAGSTPPVAAPPTAPAPTPAPPAPAPVKPIAAVSLPKASSVILLPSARTCVSRRNFRIRLKQPKGLKIKSAVVALNGKRVATRSGKRVTAPVDLRGLPKGRFTVKITVTLTDGRKLSSTRRYKTCAPKR